MYSKKANQTKKNKLLWEITTLLEFCGVRYWLESGTLLGIVRENDHIDTHHDIDIGIAASSLNEFLVFKQRLWPKYRMKSRGNQSGRAWIDGDFSRFRIIRIWEQMQRASTKIIIKVKYKTEGTYRWTDHRSCKSVSADYYDKLGTIQYNGKNFPIPSNVEQYLADCYGDWRTPHKYFQNRIDDHAIVDEDKIESIPFLIRQQTERKGKPKKIKLEGYYLSRMKNMLFETMDLFEKHNIKYWVDDGTLLGIIRDGGLIPWDNDVDLGIAGESVANLSLLKYHFLPKYLLRKKTTPDQWIPGGIWAFKVKTILDKIRHINFHIDLFAKYKLGNRYQWIDCGALKHIETKYYDNLDHVKWEGRNIPIPSYTEDYLAIRYGDWQTPSRTYNPARDDGAIAEKGF